MKRWRCSSEPFLQMKGKTIETLHIVDHFVSHRVEVKFYIHFWTKPEAPPTRVLCVSACINRTNKVNAIHIIMQLQSFHNFLSFSFLRIFFSATRGRCISYFSLIKTWNNFIMSRTLVFKWNVLFFCRVRSERRQDEWIFSRCQVFQTVK